MLVEILDAEVRLTAATGRPYIRLVVLDDYETKHFMNLSLLNAVTRAELEHQFRCFDIITEPLENWRGKLLSVTWQRVQWANQTHRFLLMLNINVVRLGLFPDFLTVH